MERLTELAMDKAPSAGTDIHWALEAYLKGIELEESKSARCQSVFTGIGMHVAVKDSAWISEANFVHPLGFGGQVDLHNDRWIIDFKSKQSADKFKPGKMAYQEHSMQLAAYREGLRLGGSWARCANVFICLENGEVDFHEHSSEELQKGWQLFQHCLAIWQLQNNYQVGQP